MGPAGQAEGYENGLARYSAPAQIHRLDNRPGEQIGLMFTEIAAYSGSLGTERETTSSKYWATYSQGPSPTE